MTFLKGSNEPGRMCLLGVTLWSLALSLPVLPVQIGVWWCWRPKTSELPHWPELGRGSPQGWAWAQSKNCSQTRAAEVQPSLFICDHNKSHDIYVHTPASFIGLSNWRWTSYLSCTLDQTLSMPAHRTEGTYLREGRYHRWNCISSLLLGNSHWMCNISLRYLTCYYSSFPNGH